MNPFGAACLLIALAAGTVFMFIVDIIAYHNINLGYILVVALQIYVLLTFNKEGYNELIEVLREKYRK